MIWDNPTLTQPAQIVHIKEIKIYTNLKWTGEKLRKITCVLFVSTALLIQFKTVSTDFSYAVSILIFIFTSPDS